MFPLNIVPLYELGQQVTVAKPLLGYVKYGSNPEIYESGQRVSLAAGTMLEIVGYIESYDWRESDSDQSEHHFRYRLKHAYYGTRSRVEYRTFGGNKVPFAVPHLQIVLVKRSKENELTLARDPGGQRSIYFGNGDIITLRAQADPITFNNVFGGKLEVVTLAAGTPLRIIDVVITEEGGQLSTGSRPHTAFYRVERVNGHMVYDLFWKSCDYIPEKDIKPVAD